VPDRKFYLQPLDLREKQNPTVHTTIPGTSGANLTTFSDSLVDQYV
jgi:hypothetical protein